MSQDSINQRLNFLLNALGMKAGSFSRALGVSETTVRNYLDRNSKPSSDILEKIFHTFEQVNLVWLITGEGEPFKEGSTPTQDKTNIFGKKNVVNVSGTNIGPATQTNNYTISDCEKERDSYKNQLELANKEIESLQSQLEWTKIIIESKNDIIGILKAPHHGSTTSESAS